MASPKKVVRCLDGNSRIPEDLQLIWFFSVRGKLSGSFSHIYPKAVGRILHHSVESVPRPKVRLLGPATPSSHRATAPGGSIGRPALDLSPKSNIKATAR